MYSISISIFYWYTSGYLVSSIIVSVPLSQVVARRGVRYGIFLGAVCLILGSWLMVFINESFVYPFIGQYLLGASFPIVLNCMTQFSAHWFGPKDVKKE